MARTRIVTFVSVTAFPDPQLPPNRSSAARSSAEPSESDPGAFALDVVPLGDRKVRVSAEGELDLVTSPDLEQALRRELLADRDVLLDLSRIGFIDSTGLHAIVKSVRTAKEAGRVLTLNADLSPHTRRLMEIVGLLSFIPITGSEPG
jgi:anti-anti-sigma factor